MFRELHMELKWLGNDAYYNSTICTTKVLKNAPVKAKTITYSTDKDIHRAKT
jgi:hypothetical protein